MKRKVHKLFLITLLLLFLASGFSKAASYTITVNDFEFAPDSMTVLIGDTVQWVWQSGFHTTTSNGIPDNAAPWNELMDSMHTSFTYIVTAPGTYHYISVPDLPGMEGEFTATFPIGISSPFLADVDFHVFSNLTHNSLSVEFSIPSDGNVEMFMYDMNGKIVLSLLSENIPSGKQSRNIYFPETITPGMYFICMRYKGMRLTQKIIIE